MSTYFIRELFSFGGQKNTAGSKARVDADSILMNVGCCPIEVVQSVKYKKNSPSMLSKVARRICAKRDWIKATAKLSKGDILFVQVPIRNHSYGVASALAQLACRGVHIVPIVHDLELIRNAKMRNRFSVGKYYLMAEEKLIIKSASSIIAHNSEMVDLFGQLFGTEVKNKALSLECFDYLLDDNSPYSCCSEPGEGLLIAGNLDRNKAGYVYALPGNCRFLLYGINYDGDDHDNVLYMGSFAPEELPSHLKGSFGLVWDGPSPNSCVGVYGDYLRYNNPHKASLYLACGIPIMIWNQAAMAKFVTDRGVGVAISSLDEIGKTLEGISVEDYLLMKRNSEELAVSLREGRFLTAAIENVARNFEELQH